MGRKGGVSSVRVGVVWGVRQWGMGEKRERGRETFFDVPVVMTARFGWVAGVVVEGVLVRGHLVLE